MDKSLIINDKYISYCTFKRHFDYYYSITHNENKEYTLEIDDFKWDRFNDMSPYSKYLLGKTSVLVESIDVELFKYLIPTIQSFTGEIIYMSYKGIYNLPNCEIFYKIIKKCQQLKSLTLNTGNSLYCEGSKSYLLDLTTLYYSNLDEFILKTDILNRSDLDIIMNETLPIRSKPLIIKINMNHSLFKKYEPYGILFSK